MIKSVFKSGILQLIGFGAGFAVHVGLARMIRVEEYGLYNFIFALSSILAMIAMFGLPQAAIRLIQDYQSGKDTARLKGLLIFSRVLPVFLGLFLGLTTYTILFYTMQNKGEGIEVLSLAVGVALVPLLALLRVHSGLLRGFHKIAASVFYEVAYRDLVFALILLAGISVATATDALTVLTAVVAVGAVLSGLHAHLTNHTDDKPQFDMRNWLAVSLPMLLTVATRMLMVRTDLIVLGLMVSAVDLGIYAGAAKFALLMSLAQMAVMPFFSPNAAQLFQAGKQADLRALFFKAQGLQALGGLGLFILLLLIGKPLLGMLGPVYVAGYPVFAILLIGQFIGVACGPSSMILEMSTYQKQAMKVVMVFTGLNLVLTLVLIKIMGLEGAALATAVSFVGQNIACYAVAWNKGLIKHDT